MRARTSGICLGVFVVMLVLSGFLTAAGGGAVGWYASMASCALVALLAGPRLYRALAAVALGISVFLTVMDYRAGAGFKEWRRAVTRGQSTTRTGTNAGGEQVVADSEATKKESLYQEALSSFRRLESDLRERLPVESGAFPTNVLAFPDRDSAFQAFFELNWIHSSMGMRWDEIPPPTVHGADATEGVRRFVAEHGWHMNTNDLAVALWDPTHARPFRGLPWVAIQEREFRAVTYDGVLYVPLRKGHVADGFACSGVAYNPATNRFPDSLRGVKNIGEHWYCWRQGDD